MMVMMMLLLMVLDVLHGWNTSARLFFEVIAADRIGRALTVLVDVAFVGWRTLATAEGPEI